MLEVMTRRYYRIQRLLNFRSLAQDGQCYVSAEYDEKGKRVHIFATHAEILPARGGGAGDVSLD